MNIFNTEIDDRLISYAARFGYEYAACDHDGLVFMSREQPQMCTEDHDQWEFSSSDFWPVAFTDAPEKKVIKLEGWK